MSDLHHDAAHLIAKADGDVFLTVKELAAIKRVHPETVKRWCRQGLIPAERTAGQRGHWRIKYRPAA
jgi:excisionase family DNA binding protein